MRKKITKKNSSTIPLGNTKVTSYSVSVVFPSVFRFCFYLSAMLIFITATLMLWMRNMLGNFKLELWNIVWRVTEFFFLYFPNGILCICSLLLVTSVCVLFFDLYPSALHRNSKLLPNKIAVIRLKRQNVHKM